MLGQRHQDCQDEDSYIIFTKDWKTKLNLSEFSKWNNRGWCLFHIMIWSDTIISKLTYFVCLNTNHCRKTNYDFRCVDVTVKAGRYKRTKRKTLYQQSPVLHFADWSIHPDLHRALTLSLYGYITQLHNCYSHFRLCHFNINKCHFGIAYETTIVVISTWFVNL